MKKIKSLLLVVLLSVFSVTASYAAVKAAGVKEIKNGPLSAFSKLDITGGVDVEIVFGAEYAYALEGDQAYLSYYTLTQKEDVVKLVYQKFKPSNKDERVSLKITVPAVDFDKLHLEVSAGSNLVLPNLKANKLNIEVTAGSKVIAKGGLSAKKLDVELTAGSEVELIGLHGVKDFGFEGKAGSKAVVAGEVDELDLELVTASDFDGKGLTVEELKCELKAGSKAVVGKVSKKIVEVESIAGSELKYGGDPKRGDIVLKAGGECNKL